MGRVCVAYIYIYIYIYRKDMRDGCHEETRFLIRIPQIAPRKPVLPKNRLSLHGEIVSVKN